MPELVEVEAFRWGLLPLVVEDAQKKGFRLRIERTKDNPPKNFLTDDQIEALNDNCVVAEVTRKGKLLCMALDCVKPVTLEDKKEHHRIYMFCHMSMTGRISTPDHVVALEEQKSTEYPSPYTYLKWTLVDPKKTGDEATVAEACFSDPRKFGSIELAVDRSQFDDLAPDGLEIEKDEKVKEQVVAALTEKTTAIKALLLDQKRATSGVGNWIADEIMYQCEMHPEQKLLTKEEALRVVDKLSYVLKTGLDHLKRKEEFPKDWMFGYRWTKKAKDSKDGKGRAIEFVKVGGRTSAIVPEIQKLESRGKETKKKKKATPAKGDSKGDGDGKEEKKASPKKKQPAKRKVEAESDVKEEEKSPAKKKKTKQQPKADADSDVKEDEKEDGKEKKKSSPKKKQSAKRKVDADSDGKEEAKSPAKKKKTKQQTKVEADSDVKEDEKSPGKKKKTKQQPKPKEETKKEEEEPKEDVEKEKKTPFPKKKLFAEPKSEEEDDGSDSEDDLPIVKLKQKYASKAKAKKKKA